MSRTDKLGDTVEKGEVYGAKGSWYTPHIGKKCTVVDMDIVSCKLQLNVRTVSNVFFAHPNAVCMGLDKLLLFMSGCFALCQFYSAFLPQHCCFLSSSPRIVMDCFYCIFSKLSAPSSSVGPSSPPISYQQKQKQQQKQQQRARCERREGNFREREKSEKPLFPNQGKDDIFKPEQ